MEEQPTDADWRNWLDRHGPGFGLFARQKAHSEMDAQDLVQEAILEAAERAAPALPPPALVFATIQRRAIDRARSANRRAAREMSAATDQPVVWFDVTPEERERAQFIQSALAKLPESYREVIALKVWSDLTFAEISEALGIPPNTAASRYRYGLQELRKLTREVFT
jgi:RNA polymerase sigma-70 factor (ECF subfamily)